MSNAELIERARELRMDAEKGNPVERIRMLGELANALADTERERDEYMERFRNVSDANSDILDQLWAAQAVIAEAQACLEQADQGDSFGPIEDILAQSPVDVLQAHDRQVAAKAVRVELLRMADVAEGSAAWTENNFLPGPNSDYAIRHEREMAEWLRDSAAAIVSEPSTPEQPEGENR